MLTKAQLSEIREHLSKAQNPLFFFDNDADGLCSYLLLRRYLGRGKGVAIRSYPELNAMYAKKAQELKADYVFILDKPVLSKEFVEEIEAMHLPLVWIDHHNVSSGNINEKFPNVNIYNPAILKGKNKSQEPVTYLSHMITQRKEDLWIAIMGCVADHYLPSFSKEFGKLYPEFWAKNIKEPFDVYYKTEIGRIAQSLNFGLKNSTSHTVELQNFLIQCKGPDEVISESAPVSFRENYSALRKRYDSLITRAEENITENLIFFEYGGETSMSAELSNELSYKHPSKYIVVAYSDGSLTKISLRGKNVKSIIEKIIVHFEGGTGGGHPDAVGAKIKSSDIGKFKELLEKEIHGR
ncbi:DHH family phosphoesterase [Candidatus Pacearchaeota archaeon]|nr:DHH family phosphoesterase [Candidatus Pacearchaeota archaeon]